MLPIVVFEAQPPGQGGIHDRFGSSLARSRVRRSFTSSIPTKQPYPATSPISGWAPSSRSSRSRCSGSKLPARGRPERVFSM